MKGVQLSKNFNSEEFRCRCRKCSEDGTKISMELISKLQVVRREMGIPIVVTSGIRCPAHNKREGGVVNSAHTKRLAADITAGLSNNAKLYEVCKKHFKRIGRGGSFVHVDVDESLPEGEWHY